MANLPDLTADVKVGFSDLEVAAIKAKLLGDVLKKELGSSEVSKATNDVANGIRNIGNSSGNSTPGITALGSGLAEVGSTISAVLIPTLIGLAAALSPVIVLLTAFTVGLAAAFTTMTLGLGLFAGLAAGAVALAAATGQLGDASGKGAASAAELEKAQANLTAAQKKYGDSSYQAALAQEKLTQLQEQGKGPLADLTDHFHQLADTMGKEAAPAAREVLNWANAMLDPITSLGTHIADWINSNQRLTNSLDIIGTFANDTIDVLENRLGPAIGRFADQWISRGPQWEALWRSTLGKAADAVDGLLTNLLRLSDWFTTRLPVLGPQVQTIMGAIGNVIQGIGTAAGAVADFFITHWPDITKAAQGVFDNIAIGFNYVLPLLGLAIAAFQKLDPVIQFIQQHADSLRPVLFAVGGLLVIMAGSAVLTAGAVVLLVGGIVGLSVVVSELVRKLRDDLLQTIQQVGGWFSALGTWARGVANDFWGLVSAAQSAANAVRNVPVLGGLAGLAGFATGGVAVPGQTFMVGEQGPEIGYALPGGGVMISPLAGGGSTAQDPRPSTANQLLAEQNALLRAFLQAVVNQPAPVGRWPYQGRTV